MATLLNGHAAAAVYKMEIIFALLISAVIYANGESVSNSLPYCANYLCPKYPRALAVYMARGCEGNFRSLVESMGSEASASAIGDLFDRKVTLGTSIFLASCCFLVSYAVGHYMGHVHSLKWG